MSTVCTGHKKSAEESNMNREAESPPEREVLCAYTHTCVGFVKVKNGIEGSHTEIHTMGAVIKICIVFLSHY